MSVVEAVDPATIPGALELFMRREVGDGDGLIEFEFAPAGWLMSSGEVRQKDWRAYFYVVNAVCSTCDGSGRIPSEKRPGNTIQCKACNGTGDPKASSHGVCHHAYRRDHPEGWAAAVV